MLCVPCMLMINYDCACINPKGRVKYLHCILIKLQVISKILIFSPLLPHILFSDTTKSSVAAKKASSFLSNWRLASHTVIKRCIDFCHCETVHCRGSGYLTVLSGSGPARKGRLVGRRTSSRVRFLPLCFDRHSVQTLIGLLSLDPVYFDTAHSSARRAAR